MDDETRRTIIYTTIFLLGGVFFALALAKSLGTPEDKTLRDPKVEKAFFAQVLEQTPGYDPKLEKEMVEMGWRMCGKLSSGWDPTRVLSLVSQPFSSETKTGTPAVTSAQEIQFWIRVEKSAVKFLCPKHSGKLQGWPKDLDKDIARLTNSEEKKSE